MSLNNTGRKTKLTPEVRKRIIQALQLGASFKDAAEYGDICYKTFYRWFKKGKENQKSEYNEFYKLVSKARSNFNLKLLLRIEQAASEGNWRAAAWLLERRCRDEYGKKTD